MRQDEYGGQSRTGDAFGLSPRLALECLTRRTAGFLVVIADKISRSTLRGLCPGDPIRLRRSAM